MSIFNSYVKLPDGIHRKVTLLKISAPLRKTSARKDACLGPGSSAATCLMPHVWAATYTGRLERLRKWFHLLKLMMQRWGQVGSGHALNSSTHDLGKTMSSLSGNSPVEQLHTYQTYHLCQLND